MILKTLIVILLSIFLSSCYTQLQTVKKVEYVEYEDDSDEYYEEEEVDSSEAYTVSDEFGNTYNFYFDDPYYHDYWDYGYYPGHTFISLGYGWGYHNPYRYYRPYGYYPWYDDWCYYGYGYY